MSDRMTYVTHGGLRQRGWTDVMVRELLGEPDVQGRDPRRWTPAPVRLYLLARVEAVERTPEFAAYAAAGGRGAAAARAAAEKRHRAVLAAIRAEPIRVPMLPRAELELRAARHRRPGVGPPPPGAPAPPEAAPRGSSRVSGVSGASGAGPARQASGPAGALVRWQVDYLRQALARYDALLDGLFAATGRSEAERLLRRRVYEAIAQAYPWLAEECRRRIGGAE
ncbi:hypothetical protein ACIRD2_18360 [Streptomyces sp. NPDC093595]|uniref:hypothetical protein n=1 Tax=Streptomyces sp. NPDC093595 TaxID=3366045 RepID=UPI0038038084